MHADSRNTVCCSASGPFLETSYCKLYAALAASLRGIRVGKSQGIGRRAGMCEFLRFLSRTTPKCEFNELQATTGKHLFWWAVASFMRKQLLQCIQLEIAWRCGRVSHAAARVS